MSAAAVRVEPAWLVLRLAQAAAGDLAVPVDHADVLVLP